MAAGNLFRTLGPSLNMGIQLGLRSADDARADAREERMAKLQESQAIAASLQTWMKIDEIADPKLRNHLFGLYAERQRTPSGQQIFGPETVAAYQKMGDESRQQVMHVLQANKEVLVGMDPEQLATMFRDPLKAYEFIGQMAKVSGEKEKVANEIREREAFGMIETGGDVRSRLASVDRAMQHARSAEGIQRLTTLRNSLLTEMENQVQAQQAQQQMAIARANLGVSQANLGLRQQELSLAKSSNPAERYAAEMFDKPFNRLSPEQRGQVNRQIAAESLERAQHMGSLQAAQRATPAQQTEELSALQSSLDMLDFMESKYKPEYSGPIRGGVEAWYMEKAGGMEDQEIDFRAAAATYQNILTQIRSGAAVTAQESVRLAREAPLPTDRPEQLLGKIRVSKSIVTNAMKRRQEALKSGGYGHVPTFTPRSTETAPGVSMEEVP